MSANPNPALEALSVVEVAAPRLPLEDALRVLPGEDGFLWSAPTTEGLRCAGAGVAMRIDLAGEGRFGEMRRRAAAALRDLAGGETPLRFFGGFAFALGAADELPWRSFGDASFVLPRWLYLHEGADRARLIRTQDDPSASVESVVAALQAASNAVAGTTDTGSPRIAREGDRARLGGRAARQNSKDGDFCEMVDGAIDGIRDGALDKVVLARRAVVELDGLPDPLAMLGRLPSSDCWRFGFRRGDAWFVGASPERLVAREGRNIQVDALAGSASASSDEKALLNSRKDRDEHAVVVEAIESALDPLCSALDHPAQPKIRRLRHLLHLHTPVAGELREDTHVLELVEALHPTPAVGGWPRAAALEWIRASEPDPRGWYAGPVGWLDAKGDGEFAVAIRSALLEPRRAHVYAGAGIVRGSSPAREEAEVELKLRGVLDALGVAP